MASPYPDGDREKVASKLPSALQQALKVRAAELSLDIQDAVEAAINDWRESTSGGADVDTAGARSFSTWLPPGLYEQFKETCTDRGVSYTQGLAQSIRGWLDANPSPRYGVRGTGTDPERKIVGNQKGGVGKTAISAGIGEAYAEAGKRVLVVDFDPQGHLSEQLGVPQIEPDHDSLVSHMCGEGSGDLRDLVVEIKDPRFEKRLHVLPACFDGFLLDAKIAVVAMQKRGFQKEAALELALRPLEADYDVVIVDCPPSLGIAMDAALYYGRRRRGEAAAGSGVVIPVLAEDSSATAYGMLSQQIEDLCDDLSLGIDYLGLVVNLYDSRRGYVATSSLDNWKSLGDPKVLAVIGDLKEQREAVRKRMPLLSYAPQSDQAEAMRQVARGATR